MPETPHTPTPLIFEFLASDMQRILDTKPSKVVCTCFTESVEAKDGTLVGALRIIATGEGTTAAKGATLEDDPTIDGVPRPPGY